MEVNSAVSISEYFRVDHPKLGLCEATVLDGTLSDLRICANGSSMNGQGVFINDFSKAMAIRDALNALMGEVEQAIIEASKPKAVKNFEATTSRNAPERDADTR